LEDQELLEQLERTERLMLRVGWLEQRRFARDLAEFGLTVPQFLALRSMLRRDEQPTMSTLADETLHRCATMTGIVDRLAKMGLVTRQRDPGDRRRVLVELTLHGRELMDKVRLSRRERLRETLVHLSSDDAGELLRLLSLYLAAFREQLEEDTPQ
jgi:DNA-binding MarR family transcriptional regulator